MGSTSQKVVWVAIIKNLNLNCDISFKVEFLFEVFSKMCLGTTTMTMQEKQRILENEFEAISSWEDRYNKIIQMGKALPPVDEKIKHSANLVQGCQSQVWIVLTTSQNGSIHIEADSDALIVKGLLSLVLKIYNDSTPQEILSTPPSFLKNLGLDSHLSPSRANGLRAMIQKIIMLSLQEMNKQKS